MYGIQTLRNLNAKTDPEVAYAGLPIVSRPDGYYYQTLKNELIPLKPKAN